MLNVKSLLRAHQIAAQFRATLPYDGLWQGKKDAPKMLLVKEEGPTGTLYLYDQIGGDGCFNEGITAIAVVEALDSLEAKGCKAVAVRISSEGGDVFEGKAIFEALKRCKMAVTTYNDSIAASAASFIAMAGSKVVSAPQATWMVHRAWSLGMGNAEDLRSVADILQLEDQNIAAMYAEKTGKTPDECMGLMSAETWMNAEQAKESGFADEIARDDGDAGGDEQDSAASSSAKAVLKIAATTQERIRSCANAKVLLEQRQRIARASPGSTTPQRPAARK